MHYARRKIMSPRTRNACRDRRTVREARRLMLSLARLGARVDVKQVDRLVEQEVQIRSAAALVDELTRACVAIRQSGWSQEGCPDHAGQLIGYVVCDDCWPDAVVHREVHMPSDDKARELVRVGAGCQCGWRSARWLPMAAAHWSPKFPAVWSPFFVRAAREDHTRARELWERHLKQDVVPSATSAPALRSVTPSGVLVSDVERTAALSVTEWVM
jgi:hypothetical protein